jgi:hypothetical protein
VVIGLFAIPRELAGIVIHFISLYLYSQMLEHLRKKDLL